MPRIDPIRTKDQVPPEHHEAFDQLVSKRGGITGPSNFLMYSPVLNLRYSPIVGYFREDSPISLHHQEVAILTTVREKASAYPWGGHVIRARDAGVPEPVIDAIRSRGSLDAIDSDDAAIIRYARQLTSGTHVDQPTFDRLHTKFGNQWLVELTLLIGHYQGTATCSTPSNWNLDREPIHFPQSNPVARIQRHFVANTQWWPPSRFAVDWLVATILVIEITVGVSFH